MKNGAHSGNHTTFGKFAKFASSAHCHFLNPLYLRINSDLCHLQYKLIGIYNRDEKCLLRGTNWVFK